MLYRVSADSIHIRLGVSDTVSSVMQNVAIILRTKQGTVPMYREFGLPQNYIGMPTNLARPLMYAEIREAIETFEPRCRVADVTFTEPMPGHLIPTVEVEIADE